MSFGVRGVVGVGCFVVGIWEGLGRVGLGEVLCGRLKREGI